MNKLFLHLLQTLLLALCLCICSTSFAEDSSGKSNTTQSTSSKAKKAKSSSSNTSNKSTKSTTSNAAKKKNAKAATKKKSAVKKSTKKITAKSPAKRSNTDKSSSKEVSKPSQGTLTKSKEYKKLAFETWSQPDPLVSEKGLPMMVGFVQPYSYGNLMRQFNGGKNCHHRGLDIGAVGTRNGGLGTPISSVTRSVVTFIGETGQNVGEFGKRDLRPGQAKRGGKMYERLMFVPGYGAVYPFSRNYGRWRSGTVLVTKVLDGPLKDYTIRYMHMANVRPDLKVGSVVEAGEHIAIMGSTAILDSTPHVHIDMENPAGERRDLAPYIGLPDTSLECSRQYADKPDLIPKTVDYANILVPTNESSDLPAKRTLERTQRDQSDELL